jgi:hypothetical protein
MQFVQMEIPAILIFIVQLLIQQNFHFLDLVLYLNLDF